MCQGLTPLTSMDKTADFYLTTAGEFEPLREPRACTTVGRVRDSRRDDYMLVEIDPHLPGQQFGLGEKGISLLILSTRHVGHSLFPITEWPCYVYVARILDDSIVASGSFSASQVELIAKGTLYRSAMDAI
jgi:hypothetical protein